MDLFGMFYNGPPMFEISVMEKNTSGVLVYYWMTL
jgi:hypothetical protein